MKASQVTPGVNAVANDHNYLLDDVSQASFDIVTVTPNGSNQAIIDLSLKYKIYSIPLNALPVAISFTNYERPRAVLLQLVQNGAGSNTATWPTIKWVGGPITAPPLTATPAATDMFLIVVKGDGVYEGYFAGFGVL